MMEITDNEEVCLILQFRERKAAKEAEIKKLISDAIGRSAPKWEHLDTWPGTLHIASHIFAALKNRNLLDLSV
jgi:hypothetical protein